MVQAEQSVIGCLMMAPELLDKARAVLSPAMFEAQPLARIFRAMMYLARIRFARFHRLSAHETIETVKNDHAEGRRVWGRLTTPK